MMDYIYPFTTMSFAYPWVLLFPFLILFLFRISKLQRAAVSYPDISLISSIPASLRLRLRKPTLGLLSALTIFFLAVAGARPQRSSVLEQSVEARNIMLALDLSRSMSARDFQSKRGVLSRASGVKSVVSEFIKSRPGDRLGVVVFGSVALLLSPLTLDHGLVHDLVEKLEPGVAEDGTAIGDGLGLSLKRLREIDGKSKAIILMTDGVNNSGQVNPLKAALVAKELGIKIHTVGIGSNDPVSIDVPGGIFGQRVLSRVEFDEATLKEIAELTGGVYFNASSLEGLKEVYAEIDRLEKSDADSPQSKKVEELFPKFLILGTISYLLLVLLSRFVFLKVP